MERQQGGPAPVAGGGEMSQRIRGFAWAATELGPVENWPPSLSVAADIMLHCGFPATLQWGPNAILLYNDAYIGLIGARHPMALGKPIFESFPEIIETYEPMLRRVRAGETIVLRDLMFTYTRDGKLEDCWFDLSYSPVLGEDGDVAGVLAIGLESTARVLAERSRDRKEAERRQASMERASAEQALMESEQEFTALVNATSEVVYTMSADWTELYHLRGGGFLTDTYSVNSDWLQQYVHSEDRAKVMAAVREALEKKSLYQVEHRVIQADGSVGWTLSRAVPLTNSAGEVTAWFGAANNITTQKRAEAALRESEKLAVVGRLAMSIAHEINNPLEAVTNLLYLAATTAATPETTRFLEMAQVELARVNQITSETLRFHKQSTKASPTSLSEIAESVVRLHQGRLRGAQIVVQRRYRPHAPVLCYPNEIRQVAANLIGNAIDAILGSPERSLFLRVRPCHDPATGRAGVRLTVADTGLGMSHSTQRRVFEAFFTTKEATGTGLGLWVSHEIIKKHQGSIRVRSRQAETGSTGTVFAVFLPL